MALVVFDIFNALDGNCLNGMEGESGILRQRFYSDGETLRWDEPFIRYYAGAAGGHAVQINPQGDIGFLGGWLDTGVIFDPRSLRKIANYNAMNISREKVEIDFRSPTHMVFPKDGGAWTPEFAERSGITACGSYFWEVDLSDPRHAKRLAPHKLGLPHALKLSATGRYIFCGAADSEPGQRARRVGIFEPRTGKMQIVNLQRTSWHIQTHPTEDIIYAVSQNYEEGEKPSYSRWGNDISIPVESNFIWKIIPDDGHGRPWVRPYAMSMNFPSHLSSDIIVIGDKDDTVLYNSCASSTITMVRLGREEFPSYVDEGVWWFKGPHSIFRFGLPRLGLLRSYGRDLREVLWRTDKLFGNKLIRRAEFVTRNSLVDGSYGLILSPDNRWLISSHRGGNWLLAYKYPEVLEEGHKALAYRVKLPPIRKHMPHNCPATCGVLTDQRLGLHHSAMFVVPD